MSVVITRVRAICTAPEGIALVIVKVETNQDGLYGIGCATFTQRYLSVAKAIEDYFEPLLCGKEVNRIEDIWQMAMVSSYWRNDGILNNGLSGVDMALWDIKGKMANMPLYELFGGKVREGIRVYRHADGSSFDGVANQVQKFIEEGIQVIRLQFGGYGGKEMIFSQPKGAKKTKDYAYYDPLKYQLNTVELFKEMRNRFGFEIEFCHDVHERLEPIEAIRLAKELEPYRLFFLEDALAPEQKDWFHLMRQQTHTPLAMGELFNNPLEWMDLISSRLIDYIRCHVSQIGGITPARKLQMQCELFGVRTAWHGPRDTSPVGHAAQVHLNLSAWNFGIQEWSDWTPKSEEVFSGLPKLTGGYVYGNELPGLGIDIDEEKAAEYPCDTTLPTWTNARRPDGTLARP
jgi:mannonate dehydratase